jgi:UrcA family protein
METVSGHIKYLALAAIGCTLATGATATPLADEVVVEKTRPALRITRSSLGAPERVVSVTRRVNVTDLNPRTHSGALQLEARIVQTANSLCDRLSRMQPLTIEERRTCIRDAVAGAMEQVRAAMAVAEREDAVP